MQHTQIALRFLGVHYYYYGTTLQRAFTFKHVVQHLAWRNHIKRDATLIYFPQHSNEVANNDIMVENVFFLTFSTHTYGCKLHSKIISALYHVVDKNVSFQMMETIQKGNKSPAVDLNQSNPPRFNHESYQLLWTHHLKWYAFKSRSN